VEQIRKASEIMASNLKYKFYLAKFLTITGKVAEAVNILRDVIQKEKLYAVIIVNDSDLNTKNEIRKMLDDETESVVGEVQQYLDRINSVIVPGSAILSTIRTIEQAFCPRTYISARTILETYK